MLPTKNWTMEISLKMMIMLDYESFFFCYDDVLLLTWTWPPKRKEKSFVENGKRI